VVVAHRRAGKTVAALNGLIRTALTCDKPNPRCAYVAPYLGQAKAVAWDLLKRFTAPIPGASWNEAELRCEQSSEGDCRQQLAVLGTRIAAMEELVKELGHDIKNLLTGRVIPARRGRPACD
jgi:hypothetical protein